MSHRTRSLAVLTALAVLPIVGVTTPAIAGCPVPDGSPQSKYAFSNVAQSLRPTNLYSAYITGPGSITYNKWADASVGASATAEVSAEAGVVFAKASTTIGVGVTASRSWGSSFEYTLEVPSGQRRRMRLFEESRSFTVKKTSWNTGTCSYQPAYTGTANAPRTTRVDEWRLEA